MSSNVPSVRNISVSTAQSNKLPLGLLLQRRRRPALHCTAPPHPGFTLPGPQHSAATLHQSRVTLCRAAPLPHQA